MCGICGSVGRAAVDREVLGRMTSTLSHRGPDDEGFFVGEHTNGVAIGLGFRRLSIIDPATGNQPLANEDGSVQLILNGEIYNYRELRDELVRSGHTFRTRSDAEVFVHLYEQRGADALSALEGMFALALWDAHEQTLLLARDRFGKKPLYYAQVGDELIFGSEPKSLLAHPRCPRALDQSSLSAYLAFEYVPTPRSIFANVNKLPAGSFLRWRDGRVGIERWWDLPSDDKPHSRSTEQNASTLREHLRVAVRRRLVSDVPIGAFLSGGIDSSSVVAMMVDELGADAVKTFSIGFDEPSFDESGHARRVASHLGTEHHEEVFTAHQLLDLLPTVTAFMDEPFGDASILPTYALSRFARETVTVALGGDGGDELLAGYPTFAADRVARFLPFPRAFTNSLLAPLANRLPVSTDNFSLDFKIKRFLRGAGLPPAARHEAWLGSFTKSEQTALLSEPVGHPSTDYAHIYESAPSQNPVNRLIHLYATTYLQDDILVKVDRASMACSLEVRAPFLDSDLASFLATVPPSQKLHRLTTKHLLKQAMRKRLPAGIVERPKKGFGVPVAAWLKGDLRELLTDELSADRLRRQGIFQPAEVERLTTEHLDGRRDHRKQLWTLLMFQLWHRTWLDRQ